MTRVTKYVALDVHQATTLASVRAETGQGLARTILPTAAPPLVAFFRGMRGAVPVLARGMREALTRVTLAANSPRSRSDSGSEEHATIRRHGRSQRTRHGSAPLARGRSLAGDSRIPGPGCGGQSQAGRQPGPSRPRHSSHGRPPRQTRRSLRPAQGPSLR
jgi:hypothetical protein